MKKRMGRSNRQRQKTEPKRESNLNPDDQLGGGLDGAPGLVNVFHASRLLELGLLSCLVLVGEVGNPASLGEGVPVPLGNT